MENNNTQNSGRAVTTASDFLLNIASIITLYTVVSTLLVLIFTVIEHAYPQITDSYYYYSSSISWPVSILIVLFPIFVLIMWALERSYKIYPEKRHLWIRKCLTYLTLFIGGGVFLGDLVTVVYYFIDGQELTTGFLFKVLAILVITIVVFTFYLADVRDKSTPNLRKVWLIISSIIVIGSIVWGFSVLGSPRTQRLIKYDEQKVRDLESLEAIVVNYFKSKETTPSSMDELMANRGYGGFNDQQTNKSYEYRKINDLSYELCAEFNKSSEDMIPKGSGYNYSPPRPFYDNYGYSWNHPAGRHCFQRSVDNSDPDYPRGTLRAE